MQTPTQSLGYFSVARFLVVGALTCVMDSWEKKHRSESTTEVALVDHWLDRDFILSWNFADMF